LHSACPGACGFAQSRPQTVDQVQRWLDVQDAHGLAQQLDAVADGTDLSPRLGELAVPVVARGGDMDVAVPKELSRHIAAGANSGEFELVKGARRALTRAE
jgi:hypothetical protein